MVQTSLMGALANPMFYVFLALGVLCALDIRIWSGDVVRRFGWAYALMALYVIYEFSVGVEYVSEKTVLYLLSRVVTFVIIITGVLYNEAFYRGKAIKWIIMVMSFFLMYSLVSGEVYSSSGRMLVGYTNSNTAGSMGALVVGMTVFYMRGRRWTVVLLLCVFAGMLGVLGGGSRAGFLMLGLLVLLRYGFNVKTVGMCMLIVALGLYILPAANIETVGIQRMVDTYEGVEGTNREVERKAAEWMIAQRPLTGWGYESFYWDETGQTVLGPHNGYLEITKQMGIPCAIIYFGILLGVIFKYFQTRRFQRQKIDLYISLAIVLLIAANYESLFIGVHEYATNLFFFSLALVSKETRIKFIKR